MLTKSQKIQKAKDRLKKVIENVYDSITTCDSEDKLKTEMLKFVHGMGYSLDELQEVLESGEMTPDVFKAQVLLKLRTLSSTDYVYVSSAFSESYEEVLSNEFGVDSATIKAENKKRAIKKQVDEFVRGKFDKLSTTEDLSELDASEQLLLSSFGDDFESAQAKFKSGEIDFSVFAQVLFKRLSKVSPELYAVLTALERGKKYAEVVEDFGYGVPSAAAVWSIEQKERRVQELSSQLLSVIETTESKLLTAGNGAEGLTSAEKRVLEKYNAGEGELGTLIIQSLRSIAPNLYKLINASNAFGKDATMTEKFEALGAPGYGKTERIRKVDRVSAYMGSEGVKDRAKAELLALGVPESSITDKLLKEKMAVMLKSNDPELYYAIISSSAKEVQGLTREEKLSHFLGVDYLKAEEEDGRRSLARLVTIELEKKQNRARARAFVKRNNGGKRVTESDIDTYIIDNFRKFNPSLYRYIATTPMIAGNLGINDRFKALGFERSGMAGQKDLFGHFERLVLKGGLKACRDKWGYVDSYRTNKPIKTSIAHISRATGLTEALVVLLVADEKLDSFLVKGNYIAYMTDRLKNYLNAHGGNPFGMSSNDTILSNGLRYIAKSFGTGNIESVSTLDVIESMAPDYLDKSKVNASKYGVRNSARETFDFVRDVVARIQDDMGDVVVPSEIPQKYSNEVHILGNIASRLGTTLKDLFAMGGVTYLGRETAGRFSKIKLDEYPYLDEMRAERDRRVKEYLDGAGEICYKDFAEAYLDICSDVYAERQDKIELISGEVLDLDTRVEEDSDENE